MTVVGSYSWLFLNGSAALDRSDLADVHTEATDTEGAQVGRILHVGTGHPRLMVVTVES